MLKNKPFVGVLDSAAAAILSASTNEVLTLAKVVVLNTDASPRTVSIWHDDTGDKGAIDATLIVKAQALSAGETRTLPLSSLFLANGSKIWAAADLAAKVNISINYTSSEQSA